MTVGVFTKHEAGTVIAMHVQLSNDTIVIAVVLHVLFETEFALRYGHRTDKKRISGWALFFCTF